MVSFLSQVKPEFSHLFMISGGNVFLKKIKVIYLLT